MFRVGEEMGTVPGEERGNGWCFGIERGEMDTVWGRKGGNG